MRPTVAEIHTGRLRANYALLRSRVRAHCGDQALTAAIVKANAYGHGLALCAHAFLAEGAPWLGVTTVEEAEQLRNALRLGAARVLVMSGFFPGEEGLVLRHNLAPHLWEPWHFSLLDAAARRAGLPPAALPVHLEIDTGMSRQGVAPGEPLAHLLRAAGVAGSGSPLRIEAALTHFSSPEHPQNHVLATQLQRFAAALAQLREAGLHPRLLHAGNSVNALGGAGLAELSTLARAHGATVMVRPGLALYGCGIAPVPEGANPAAFTSRPGPRAGDREDATHSPAEPMLAPVLRWRTEITSLRTLPAGATAGYNETFRAARPTRLALIPAGYADGLDRSLGNRGFALVRGRRAPIAGRISMDQATLDVTDIPGAALGDEVVLLGQQGEAAIPAEELAALTGTIPYEVLCRIAPRVPRLPTE